ncbi:MAG: prenyltransferase/squalene oxidase repeat-containing protein, partial [Planctomycetota bacterium]
MRKQISRVVMSAFLCCGLLLPAVGTSAEKGNGLGIGPSLLKESRRSLAKAHEYLLKKQMPDGSWVGEAPVTAMVLTAFLTEPRAEFYADDAATKAAVEKGFKFLSTFIQPNGGIYKKEYRNYVTSVCLMAYAESRDPQYAKIVDGARRYLIKFQLDEDDGISKDNPFYGGIGYGGDDRPDLSNLQLALDAIHQADLYQQELKLAAPRSDDRTPDHFDKALVFLARCQNLKRINKADYATDDGGFIYETGAYKPARSHSYGSMTYAGVKCLLFANLKNPDMADRVNKAVAWIEKNYTWDENPGFGDKAIFYYYMTAGKSLEAL